MGSLLGALAVLLVAVPGHAEPRATRDDHRSRLVTLLRSDVTRAHEQRPHGVPSAWDWAAGPRLRPLVGAERYRAFTGWGQVYRCAGRRLNRDLRVRLRRLQTWVYGDGTWRKLQDSSSLGGAAFAEDYKGPNAAPTIRSRTAQGTVVSLTPGRNFHFWPGGGRAPIGRAPTGITVTVQARIVGRSRGCALVGVGGDYWRDRTVASGNFRNSRDAGIGRMKRVGTTWRTYTMTTASDRLLKRRPLPLEASAHTLR